jgi:cation diffusion facilitator family transporter
MEVSEKTAWMSILINVILVGIKIIITLVSGSLAVKADALHSMSDVVSSGIILIGIKISKRTSRNFPYGLYKVENLVALATSLLILYAGYEIVKEVFTGPDRPLPSRIPLAAFGITVTILIAWIFSRYELKKGQETHSPSLIADARHIWTDMLSSLIILASLLSSSVNLSLDKYAAVIVVLFISRSAFTIFLDAVRVLLDASLDNTSLNRIREIVLADPRVIEVNGLWGRNAGRYKFVELDVTVRVKELEKGHIISKELENRVKMEIAKVDRVLIHYQPRKKEQYTYAVPVAKDRKTISEHFGGAPFFQFFTLQMSNGVIISEEVLKNPFLDEEKGKGIKVAEWLLENGLDVLIAQSDQAGKGPSFVLGNSGAEILLTEETEVDKILSQVKAEFYKQGFEELAPI